MTSPARDGGYTALVEEDEPDEVHARLVAEGLHLGGSPPPLSSSSSADAASLRDHSGSFTRPLRMPPPSSGPAAQPASPAVQTPTFRRRMEASHTLTLRATVAGLVLGSLVVFQNMYFFLKSGLGFGGAFTAAIVGWLAMRLAAPLSRGLAFSPMEHCYLVTVAVATGGGAIAFGFVGPVLAMTRKFAERSQSAPVPAADTLDMSWAELLLYCSALCAFGIFLAVPFREKMVVRDRLPFPSGRATAVLISSLQRGSERARRLGRTLAASFAPSFALKAARWAVAGLDTAPIFGRRALCYSWFEDFSTAFWGSALLMPGAVPYGMVTGSVAGTLISYYTLQKQGEWYYRGVPAPADGPGPDGEMCPPALGDLHAAYAYVQLTAIGMFFVDGVCLLAETAFRAMRKGGGGGGTPAERKRASVSPAPVSGGVLFGVGDAGSSRTPGIDTPPAAAALSRRSGAMTSAAADGVPAHVWVGGAAVSVLLSVLLVPLAVGDEGSPVFYLQVLVSCALAPVLGYVVVYTFGESDQALVLLAGKLITALMVVWSGSVVTGLSLAAVGACLSTQACDTLQMMKTARVLGASTSDMLVGQLVGAFASIPVGIAAFRLFTSSYVIPGPEFQAPLAGLFRSVALLFDGGDMPDHYGWFVLVGGLYVVLYHAAKWLSGDAPRAARAVALLPMPFAVALGLYIPPLVAWDFCVGSVAKAVWRRASPDTFEDKHQAVAAGMISGEGIAGVCAALAQLAGTPGAFVTVKWPR